MSQSNRSSRRLPRAFSLLEMLLAVVIIATIAAVSLKYSRPTGEAAQQRACDLTRQSLQNNADRYFSTEGRWPSRDLNEITAMKSGGSNLPLCPCDGGKYEMSGALVICPTHESTRH